MLPGSLILIGVVGILVQIAFIYVENKKKWVPAVCLKGLASVIFVIFGLLAANMRGAFEGVNGPSIARFIFIGLILGALGDILLNLRFCFKKGQIFFLAGIAAFLAGHVFYILYAAKQIENVVIYIGIGIVLAAILLVFIFTKLKGIKPAFKIFGAVYIGIVSVMAVCAAGCIREFQTTPRILFGVGALLFLVSDIVMVFNTFGKTQRLSLRATNLLLYYLGQLMIGATLFYFEGIYF